MKLEIACFNLESAIHAAQEKVDRIELCAHYELGGITPSLTLFKTLKAKYNLPIYVMIRPRGGNFVYLPGEIQQMEKEIRQFGENGADGFVFGVLTSDHRVDQSQNKTLVSLAQGKPCTFHRAFDGIHDKNKALEELIACGFTSVLTAGGEHPATAGIDTLTALKTQAQNRIQILVGGGVRSYNVSDFKNFDFVHSAATKPGSVSLALNELRGLQRAIQAL